MAERVTSKQVDCPTCPARAGEPCLGSAYSGRGHRPVQAHWKRVEAARASVVTASRTEKQSPASLVEQSAQTVAPASSETPHAKGPDRP